MKAHALKTRGIKHLVDLGINDFIEVLQDIKSFDISEKVDGSHLQFGVDRSGFFTGREIMGGSRVYDCADYPLSYATTFQRSAHMALESVLNEMQDVGLGLDDLIETEILFGKLPNAVPYDSEVNRIIFLRRVDGDINLNRLREKLEGKRVSVQILTPRTKDGKSVELIKETHVWEFSQTPTFPVSNHLANSVKERLNAFESYLDRNSYIQGFNVKDIMTIPLNKRTESVSPENWKNIKAQIKESRQECLSVVNIYKSKINEVLLDELVRKMKSSFGPDLKDGGWIEGVVFRHNKTGFQFKVVDRDMFSATKDFLWEYRNKIKTRSRSVNDNNLSFLGETLSVLASSLNLPQMATTRCRTYLKEGVRVSHSVKFDETAAYWHNFLSYRQLQLNKVLENYNNSYKDLSLTVNDKTFKYCDVTHEKTLQVFHIMQEKINSLQRGIKNAKTTNDLLMMLI